MNIILRLPSNLKQTMEIWILLRLFFLTIHAATAFCQDRTTLLRIDCGADISYDDSWKTDENFIGTGTNMEIPDTIQLVNTLRVFKQQIKNCYTLPTLLKATYFIRASFYYGNYDKLKDPPTFDIEFDGNKWTTVKTEMPPSFEYYEVVYPTQRSSVSVCLVRTHEGQFPFISTLEIWNLADNMYASMDRDVAWFMNYRYNYGVATSLSNWILGYPEDSYNRIWQASIPEKTIPLYNGESELVTTVDYPPYDAILYMVEAWETSSSINLTFQLSQSQTPISNFISIYFTEPELLSGNQTRFMDIYVNDKLQPNTVNPEWGYCDEQLINTVSEDNLNIVISPSINSTEAAVVSAIEVYTASDPLVTTWTSQDDLDGLESLIKAFDEQLNSWTWSGDPCLPNDTVWEWLGCVSNDPPRVTRIDLQGYGLHGSLPDFSKMDALQTINLANNSLGGAVPSFLGTLPNLKQLYDNWNTEYQYFKSGTTTTSNVIDTIFSDLSNNNFSGKVPASISGNKNLSYNLNGNRYIIGPTTPENKKRKKNLGLIIGLAVGLPVALLLIVVSVYFLLIRKQDQAPHQAGTKPESAAPFSEEDLNEVYQLQNSMGTRR